MKIQMFRETGALGDIIRALFEIRRKEYSNIR